jgi:AraC-like DNA-binding protein
MVISLLIIISIPFILRPCALLPPVRFTLLKVWRMQKGKFYYFVRIFTWKNSAFSFTSELIGNTSNPCIALSDTEFFQVNEIIKSIDREYECYTPSNNSAQIIRSLLNIMLLKLSEQYNTLYSKSNNGDSLIIHELSHLVDSYFIKEHHIGFYTTAFNVSDKHLNDICKRNFNCGLKKILADRLMQEARKLLLSSELSVSQISYKLNFEDNSYFNKVFKKETGLTPKRFRTLHKKFVP